ncbi:MAG: polysaccharide deacetylase family protein, partial [Actinobacteria bacterium]|nr:polysaccharide deacetylase family protein [Actinomycetota bacterium]
AGISLAYQNEFLSRPIVNEYVEILWIAIKHLWLGLQRKEHMYKVLLTHDVDNPFMVYNQGWYQLFHSIGGDLFKRRNFGLAVQRAMCKIRNDPKLDPANTFDFIMDLSEKHGLRSEFYFITDHTASSLDGRYSIESSQICSLMREIYDRGHYIGLHASYNSFRNSQQTKKEFEKLVMVAEKLGIKQDSWRGRQHYLRWENPTTWQNWEDVGLDYDSTLTFADYAGFRTGVCYEYPVFNILTRKILQLHEKPLIVMDGTLFEQKYMDLKREGALKYIEQLSSYCRLFGGTFVLLWHNSSLMEKWQKYVYKEILNIVS